MSVFIILTLMADARGAVIYHFDFDEPPGATSLRDKSGGDNNGSCTNCPDWRVGKWDNYADFNSSNTDSVDLPDNLTTSNIGSISIWLRYTMTGQGHIFFACNTCADGFGSQNEMHINIQTGGVVMLRMEGAPDVSLSTSVLNDNQIHHVVGTWNSAGNATLYEDGVQVAQVAHTANLYTANTDNFLGRPTSNTRYFDGHLFELTHWDHELSAATVRTMYQWGKYYRSDAYKFLEEDLLSLWWNRLTKRIFRWS